MVDRIDLTRAYGVDRQRRWRHGGAQSSGTTSICYGRLGDGRWFAERTGRQADNDDRQQGACVFDTGERGRVLALRLASSWMRDGAWVAQPAAFDASGRPVDGLPWVRRGSDWMLDR